MISCPLWRTSNVQFCMCSTLSLWSWSCCSDLAPSDIKSWCWSSSAHSSSWADTCHGTNQKMSPNLSQRYLKWNFLKCVCSVYTCNHWLKFLDFAVSNQYSNIITGKFINNYFCSSKLTKALNSCYIWLWYEDNPEINLNYNRMPTVTHKKKIICRKGLITFFSLKKKSGSIPYFLYTTKNYDRL